MKDQQRWIRLLNQILRSYGQYHKNRLDQEILESYQEGRFKIQKLTSTVDQSSVFLVIQEGRTVFLSGDPFHQTYVSGEWESWVIQRAESVNV